MEVDFRVKSAHVEECPSPVLNPSAPPGYQAVHGRIRPAVIDMVKYNSAVTPPEGTSMLGDWIIRNEADAIVEALEVRTNLSAIVN